MRRQSFLAAALFAAFPVVSLFAVNADQVPAHEGLRALVVSVFAAWALLLVARLLTRDWSRASLLTAGLVLLFYSYGHVYSFVEGLLLGGFTVGRHRYLFPVWGLVAVIWVYWVAIRHRRLSFRLAPLVGVGAALVVLPLIPMAAPMLTALRPQTANAPSQASPSTDAALPNIYYIIVDGYGRSDVLKDLYGADNSDFITFLERRGFFVATDARSNYSKTILSLASSLNMRSWTMSYRRKAWSLPTGSR